MLEVRTSFICSFCGINRDIKSLNSSLVEKADLTIIEKNIGGKEAQLEELQSQFMNIIEDNLAHAYTLKIRAVERELADLAKKAERSRREICNMCAVKGSQRVVVSTFICECCKQEKKGTGLKRHIDGWQDKGIYPWAITVICRQCQEDYAFSPPSNFYCPLTSDGRDYSGGEAMKKFDCACEVPEDKKDEN